MLPRRSAAVASNIEKLIAGARRDREFRGHSGRETWEIGGLANRREKAKAWPARGRSRGGLPSQHQNNLNLIPAHGHRYEERHEIQRASAQRDVKELAREAGEVRSLAGWTEKAAQRREGTIM